MPGPAAIGFPGLQNQFGMKRAIRQTVNPMDLSTIFSIYPKAVDEIHHTIQPGRFRIAAGSYEHPSHLVVGSSSWWREIDEKMPLLEIPNSSIQVANAIVVNYCQGLLGYHPESATPGLFWIPGNHTVTDLITKPELKKLLDKANRLQTAYFTNLIKMADALWAKTNGNPLTISDDMRLAAKTLGMDAKDWMQNFTMVENIRCFACGSPRNPNYPVCPNCKAVIDDKKFAALGMKFAE
jgi:hypothetical protein